MEGGGGMEGEGDKIRLLILAHILGLSIKRGCITNQDL